MKNAPESDPKPHNPGTIQHQNSHHPDCLNDQAIEAGEKDDKSSAEWEDSNEESGYSDGDKDNDNITVFQDLDSDLEDHACDTTQVALLIIQTRSSHGQ